MRENNIIPKTIKKFKATTNSNHNYPFVENIPNRNFKVESPCEAWVCDITDVAIGQGWLYLVAVMDLLAVKYRQGLPMDSTMTSSLVCDALKQAIWRIRPNRGLICQSYNMQVKKRSLLEKHSFVQSMSRKNNCWDNAFME